MEQNIMDQVYDMVMYEEDFIYFNKLNSAMCKYMTRCNNEKCTFAHKTEDLKKAICLYHFGNGCNNNASHCTFSHNKNDAIKAFKLFSNWEFKDENNDEEIIAPVEDLKAEKIRKEQERLLDLQEEATIAFHKSVILADEEMEDALLLQEEEYALNLIEEELLLQEVEEINSEEDMEADEYQEMYPEPHHYLLDMINHQQMMINYLYSSMTAY
jgi:hypothetical protein